MDGAAILDALRARFGAGVVEAHAHHGDHTAVVTRDALPGALACCRAQPELAFDMLMDLTAVDCLKFPGREDGPRFEVVYHLYSVAHNHRVRIKTRVDEDDAVLTSAVPLWPIANWFEPEERDRFAVRFAAHPTPPRLPMYSESLASPLR